MACVKIAADHSFLKTVYKERWGSVVEDCPNPVTAQWRSSDAPVLRGNAHHGKWLHNSPCQKAYSAEANPANFHV